MNEQLQAAIEQAQTSLQQWQGILAKHRAAVEEATQQIQMNRGYLQGLQKALQMTTDAESPSEDTTLLS